MYSSPILTVFLAYFWTGDQIMWFEGVAVVGSFAGIICLTLAKPDQGKKDDDSMTDLERQYAYHIGLAFTIFTSAMASVVSVAARRLRTLHYAVIGFAYGVTSTLAMAI